MSTTSLSLVGSLRAAARRGQFKRLPASIVVLAITLGALHTWVAASQYAMNEDGIAYLDMGEAFWRGDWQTAVNPVWSPLYPWLLGLVMQVVRPSLRWEYPLAHLLNFGIYLAALVCFSVFWREAGRQRVGPLVGSQGLGLWRTWPDRVWWTLGYALFAWAALCLIELWAVTPDMLMAALVFLSAAVLLRTQRSPRSWRLYGVLGLLLGLGYLAKAIMFPIGLVLLGFSLFTREGLRRAVPRVALAAGLFGLIVAAYIGAVFLVTGRVTVSEAGRLTYLRYVNGLPYPHWQGGVPGLGEPIHPSREILAEPAVFEFAAPIGGTYPIGQDPSYWYAGATPRLNLRELAATWLASGRYYLDLFFRQQAGLLLLALIGLALRRREGHPDRSGLGRWSLALTALAAFGLYGMVYVEGRYVAVFVTLLWADVLARVRWPAEPLAEKAASWLGFGAAALLVANLLIFNLEGLGSLAARPAADPASVAAARPPSWPGEVAEGLLALGVRPGDQVGVIGYAFDSFWARLARVRIVAEMPGGEAGEFWRGDAEVQARVLAAFAEAGVSAIVAEDVPGEAVLPGWQPLGQTSYAVYLLRP